jgi:hypothetical protein
MLLFGYEVEVSSKMLSVSYSSTPFSPFLFILFKVGGIEDDDNIETDYMETDMETDVETDVETDRVSEPNETYNTEVCSENAPVFFMPFLLTPFLFKPFLFTPFHSLRHSSSHSSCHSSRHSSRYSSRHTFLYYFRAMQESDTVTNTTQMEDMVTDTPQIEVLGNTDIVSNNAPSQVLI